MKRPKGPPTGDMRQSQVVTTFGPGAMVDLPKASVIIAGLDHWVGDKERIHEQRLERSLEEQLRVPELKLFAPPIDPPDALAPYAGIDAIRFPLWFLGPVEQEPWRTDGLDYRTRPLVHWDHLVKGQYLNADRKLRPVVPVRFVQACVRGHIGDIDWYGFVRRDYQSERTGQLWLDEGGSGNDFAEIWVRDAKNGNRRRPLSEAVVPGAWVLGRCAGRRPWLGPASGEPCDKPNRLLVRSASNAYFAQTLSAIAIPDAGQAVQEAIDRVYDDYLQVAESPDDVRRERRKEKVAAALEGLSDELVWADVQRRQSGAKAEVKGIRQAEIETLLAQRPSLGEDKPEGDFYARAHPLGGLPAGARGKVDRLVLVHRLREVEAQVGFTRFEPAAPDVNGELDLDVERAPLADDLSWLPAYQNRGEGVFLSFSRAAIDHWLARPGVVERGEQLVRGFEVWRQRKGRVNAKFPGVPYIMLQSLAHLMITRLSLDCGYSASAIRERIYAHPASGYGILLYTGGSGSEGTLGGLVELGKDIGRHLGRALDLGRLCSNDPVCAQHDPTDPHEERFLHGAACHGCLLIAETSCERRNELLDRALVVPTVTTAEAAFFEGEG